MAFSLQGTGESRSPYLPHVAVLKRDLLFHRPLSGQITVFASMVIDSTIANEMKTYNSLSLLLLYTLAPCYETASYLTAIGG